MMDKNSQRQASVGQPPVRKVRHWHEVLQALAGRIDDEVLAQARSHEADTADDGLRLALVTTALAHKGARITAAQLRDLVLTAESGNSAAVAETLNTDSGVPEPRYRFSPVHPASPSPDPVPEPAEYEVDLAMFATSVMPLDLTDEVSAWDDPIVAAAITRAEDEVGICALWAGWRQAVPSTAEVNAVRVFLIETTDAESAADVTSTFQSHLREAGEDTPRVEVFGPQAKLAGYQRALLGSGSLLWTAGLKARPEPVAVFDGVDGNGQPRFDENHPVLDDLERAEVAAYLFGCEAVLLTTATMVDVIEPDRGEVVPLTYRTDGLYVWPEAAAYYVDQYGLAPQVDLLGAVRAADYTPPPVNSGTLFRAEYALFNHDPE